MTFESNVAIFATMNTDLANNVKAICRRKKWQLRDLANSMAVDPAALTRAMRGNPTLETIEKMASALNVSPSRLVQRQTDINGFISVNGSDYAFNSVQELEDILNVNITPRENA